MSAQKEFDEKYITSTEICRTLDVTRASLMHAYQRGALPDPIRILHTNGTTHVMLWIRADIQLHLITWRNSMAARKGIAA